MALQFSVELRNAILAAIETVVGPSPTLEIRTDAPPANTAAADVGTLPATITLPGDWLSNPSGGAVSGNGTAGHFRIKTGTTTHIQGAVSTVGLGGDMVLDSITITAGGPVTITGFTITAGGA
jgi:hypothetical protein